MTAYRPVANEGCNSCAIKVLQDFEAPPTIALCPPTTVANRHIDCSLGSMETHIQSHNLKGESRATPTPHRSVYNVPQSVRVARERVCKSVYVARRGTQKLKHVRHAADRSVVTWSSLCSESIPVGRQCLTYTDDCSQPITGAFISFRPRYHRR